MTFAPPDIADIDCINEAAVTKWIHPGNMAGPYATATVPSNKFSADGAPTWGVDPSGMHYLRFGSLFNTNPNAITDGSLSRLISWFLKFGYPGAATQFTEVFFRYYMMIESDVPPGFNELGMKLPGLASQATKETLSLRMEHTPPAKGTDLVTYWYDAESGAGFGEILKTSALKLAYMRMLCIEQRVKLNSVAVDAAGKTTAATDGEGDVWLDGQLVWTTRAKRWRWFPDTMLDMAHINFYHGGGKNPIGPLHYRIARIAASTQRIGPAPELAASPVPPPPVIVVTPPTQGDDMPVTQAQLDDLAVKIKAANDAAAVAQAAGAPTDQTAAIQTLQSQLTDMMAQRDAAVTKFNTLSADINAVLKKDA